MLVTHDRKALFAKIWKITQLLFNSPFIWGAKLELGLPLKVYQGALFWNIRKIRGYMCYVEATASGKGGTNQTFP